MIRWATSVTSGKRVPVDDAPSRDEGNILLVDIGGENPVAVVLTGSCLTDARADGVPLYVSHFARCPQAHQWRQR